jgi:hypothetical protein
VPYWDYLHLVVYVGAPLGTLRYLSIPVVRLVAAFTRDEHRRKQCLEVLRLSRRDAYRIPSYFVDSNSPASPGSLDQPIGSGNPAPANSPARTTSGRPARRRRPDRLSRARDRQLLAGEGARDRG